MAILDSNLDDKEVYGLVILVIEEVDAIAIPSINDFIVIFCCSCNINELFNIIKSTEPLTTAYVITMELTRVRIRVRIIVRIMITVKIMVSIRIRVRIRVRIRTMVRIRVKIRSLG